MPLKTLEGREVADNLVVYDIDFGLRSRHTVSDALDRLADIDSSGAVSESVSINLLGTSILVTGNRTYWAGIDASGNAKVGWVKDRALWEASLPGNALSQGGALAVLQSGVGFVMSKAQSSLLWFSKEYSTPIASQALTGPLQAATVGPDGNFYVGTNLGIQRVTPGWEITPLQGYSGNVTALQGCGDSLWAGRPTGLDRITLAPQLAVQSYDTGIAISNTACDQDGKVIASGTSGTSGVLFFVNPATSSIRPITVPVTGKITRVSPAPGPVATGYVLDDQHHLTRFGAPSNAELSRDRNAWARRLLAESIRKND